VPESVREKVNFRPLRWVTALRVVIAALLVAFGVVIFLSFGKKEEEPVRIHIDRPSGDAGKQVLDLSDTFFITGTKGGAESFKLLADQVTGFVGDKKSLRGVHLEVVGEDGGRIYLTGDEGQFDMNDKRAQLSGHVRVEGKNGFQLSTMTLFFDGQRDVIFTSDEISFGHEGLAGTGRGLNFLTHDQILKVPAEVRVTLQPETPGDPPVSVSSGDMTLGLRQNEVVFNDSVVLTRGEQVLTGNYLKANLDDSRKKVLSVKAYGQVSATFLSGSKEAARTDLQADSLLATMTPDGKSIQKLEALGHCRLTSQGMTATSESLIAEAAEDRVALRGEPLIVDSRSRIAAQEIDLHPAERGLVAQGDVKTSFVAGDGGPKDPPASPSFFSGKEPVYFQSARLVVDDGGSAAHYSGSARGWQADDSLQAEEIVLQFSDRRMSAFRNVLCRFSGRGGDETGGKPTGASPTLIVSSAMDYLETEGTVHFRDAVKMTGSDSTVLADRMHVSLTDPTQGPRKVTRVLAEGSVRFTHLTNSGTSDRLVYTPEDGLAEMQRDAGLAEVVDHTNGRTLRGKTLTFDMRGNRVLTETMEGGRTWITLNPKNKDTRGLESKIGH
jgi:lipopolysaccharide export system protein LptA